jgi:hypothetical protein
MRDFDVSIVLFHVLEALELKGQNHRQLLDSHPFLSFLVATAIVTLKFIITAKGFGITEASEAMSDRGVLIDVDLQVEKVFVFAAYRLAIQTSSFACENALEYLMHPGWVGGCVAIGAGGNLADRDTIR